MDVDKEKKDDEDDEDEDDEDDDENDPGMFHLMLKQIITELNAL